MKNLELELSGVQSLSTQEMKSVDGGWLLLALAFVATAIATDVMMNPGDSAETFSNSFNDAFNS